VTAAKGAKTAKAPAQRMFSAILAPALAFGNYIGFVPAWTARISQEREHIRVFTANSAWAFSGFSPRIAC